MKAFNVDFAIKKGILFTILGMLASLTLLAQHPVKEYTLTLRQQKVNKTGKLVKAITVNDSIPGPTLYFTDGDSAIIHIKNEMSVPSSVHWHGILIPNYYDGVPYLSTPPVAPGKTFTVRFVIRQTGTYWYHSHMSLQEQSGLYGAIVIYPKKETRKYDTEKTIVLSDWTNENPHHVLNNLKRGLEWYSIKKGQAQSLNRVIAHHGFGERFRMARQRMPPMDISDVYYPAFLANGHKALYFPNARPGERIRLRIVDGSSSTFFHLQYAGGNMEIISADGQDVKPVAVTRMLMGSAETYDVIITVPENGQYELRASAQDGSGYTSLYFGNGKEHSAPTLPKPDVFHLEGIMMEGMAGMKMDMNGMKMYMNKKMMQREMPYINNAYIDREDINLAGSLGMPMSDMDMKGMDMGRMGGMNMDGMGMKNMKMDSLGMGNMNGMDMKNMKMDSSIGNMNGMDMKDMNMDSSGMSHMNGMGMKNMNHSEMGNMHGMDMGQEGSEDSVIFNYDMLRALHPTSFDTTKHPVRNLTFNLTGSMWRYIWSINGKTLSEKDSIQVKEGEILRITMKNETMMYHPMHLHGHFFRVLNADRTYSPLKHTVIVPPMRTITIEFLADEMGNWFFHCHILYHMMAGMARSFQYTNYEAPPIMKNYPMSKLFNDDNHWFFWGNATVASNREGGYLSYSNRKNWVQVMGDYGAWQEGKSYQTSPGWLTSAHPYEVTGTYEHFVTRFLRPYVGVVASNQDEYTKYYIDHDKTVPQNDVRGLVGVRYLLPLFLNADLRIDSRAHVRFTMSGETWLFPRIWLTYMANTDKEYEANLEYMLNQHISFTGGYNSDYKWGGGIMVRF